MTEPRCPVCGDEVDFYGCLGAFRGKHVVIERDRARGEFELLRQRVAELAKQWRDTSKALSELARTEPQNEPEHRGRSESYEECAEELLKLVEPAPEPYGEPDVPPRDSSR